ncbi:ribonuclease H-like domain-containing protein [Tanacetum coccineum]
MSITEAEYIAASEATMEVVWIRKFISGLGIVPTINEPIRMTCDNSAALYFANEPGVQKGARHYHMRSSYVREHIISRSSVEAEYRGVANVVTETAWLRNLLCELHYPLSTVTLVYCDNVSAVYMSANPVQHQRTKHIEIDIHFVRDMVTAGQVRVLHVPSRFQYANIFTKGLPSALFEEF